MWDGDSLPGMIETKFYCDVLSPPCGMETRMIGKIKTKRAYVRSEPTVWDGDVSSMDRSGEGNCGCSEPTVWDGDSANCQFSGIICELKTVLSPPCGMETLLIANSVVLFVS